MRQRRHLRRGPGGYQDEVRLWQMQAGRLRLSRISCGSSFCLLDRGAALASTRFRQRRHDHEHPEVERRARACRIDTPGKVNLCTPGANLPVTAMVALVLL